MTLFDLPERHVADTSLAAFEALLPTLRDYEFDVLIEIYNYLGATQLQDVTAGELADYLGVKLTTIRPRLTSLKNQRLLEFAPARKSNGAETIKVHPYKPTLPRSAVERARAGAGQA